MYDGTDFWPELNEAMRKYAEDLERAFLFGAEKGDLPRSLSPHVQIPCGVTLGMGERCSHGHLCGMCKYVLQLEERIKQ